MAAKRPAWIEITTLVISALGFVGTAVLGFVTFSLQSRLADVEQFEKEGTVSYRYFLVDLNAMCEAQNPEKDADSSPIFSLTRTGNYSRNDIWQESQVEGCKVTDDGASKTPDKIVPELSGAMAVFELTNDTKYDPRMTITFRKMRRTEGGLMSYASGNGQTMTKSYRFEPDEKIEPDNAETVDGDDDVGTKRHASVKIPIALVDDDDNVTSQSVWVPISISWTAPVGDHINEVRPHWVLDPSDWQKYQDAGSVIGG